MQRSKMYTPLDRIVIGLFGISSFVSAYESRKLLTRIYPVEHIRFEPTFEVVENISPLDSILQETILESVERVIYTQDYSKGIALGVASIILGGITAYLLLSSKKAYLDDLNPQIKYE